MRVLLAGALLAALPAAAQGQEPIASAGAWERAEAAGAVRTTGYGGVALGRESARPLKNALARLKRHAPDAHAAFLGEFRGALVATGPEGGLHYSAQRARFELFLSPAALAFVEEEQGGLPALLAFLERARRERALVLERAGAAATPAQVAAGLRTLRAEEAGALDRWLLEGLQDASGLVLLGVAPRERTGRKKPLDRDPALGVPVQHGGAVLLGAPAELRRMRAALDLARADAAAREWIDGGLQVLFEDTSGTGLTQATWFFRGEKFEVARHDAAQPGAFPELRFAADLHGRAIALTPGEGYDLRVHAANLVHLSVFWKLASRERNPPGLDEILPRMTAEREAWLRRNPPRK